jgi:DNA replication initiation complex subunit (GINS family)
MRLIKQFTVDVSFLTKEEIEDLVNIIETFKVEKSRNVQGGGTPAATKVEEQPQPEPEPDPVLNNSTEKALPDDLEEDVEIFKRKVGSRLRVIMERDSGTGRSLFKWYQDTVLSDPSLRVPTRALIWSKFQEASI